MSLYSLSLFHTLRYIHVCEGSTVKLAAQLKLGGTLISLEKMSAVRLQERYDTNLFHMYDICCLHMQSISQVCLLPPSLSLSLSLSLSHSPSPPPPLMHVPHVLYSNIQHAFHKAWKWPLVALYCNTMHVREHYEINDHYLLLCYEYITHILGRAPSLLYSSGFIVYRFKVGW